VVHFGNASTANNQPGRLVMFHLGIVVAHLLHVLQWCARAGFALSHLTHQAAWAEVQPSGTRPGFVKHERAYDTSRQARLVLNKTLSSSFNEPGLVEEKSS